MHKVTDPRVFLDELPGVSVIKPLMGVDPFLKCNLESYFTIIYPKVSVSCTLSLVMLVITSKLFRLIKNILLVFFFLHYATYHDVYNAN